MSDFLTVRQVAGVFGVRSVTVRKWIREGALRAKKDVVTGRNFVPVAEIERRKSDLQDWQPGLKPVTFKDAPGGAFTSDSKEEMDMVKKDEKDGQATEQQGQTNQRVPARRERAPPPPKKSSWGTVLDDDEDEGDEDEEE